MSGNHHLMYKIRPEIVRRPHHHAGRDMILIGAEDGGGFVRGLAGPLRLLGWAAEGPDPRPAATSLMCLRCDHRK